MLVQPSVLIDAILLLGGRGTRFKSALPKQFHTIAGKKIYLHTLERFLSSDLFHKIILVCPKEWISEIEEELKNYPSEKIVVTAGGETRQESSYLGLLACSSHTDFVVIHDAVRPFVSDRILKENIHACQQYGAANTCLPSTDTLVRSQDLEQIDAIPPRQHYLRGQTPQSFAYPLILQAHEAARSCRMSVTDDCSLVLAINHPVHIVMGDELNIKITTDLDLYLAEQLFRAAQPQSNLCPAPLSLEGRCFAITGGTGGIGRAIAELLHQEGATSLLLSRSSLSYPVDLASYHETRDLFDRLYSTHGPIDGLINCVGLFKRKEVKELTPQEIEELIATNLTSVIFACKYAILKEGGSILNISSSAYSRGREGYAIYSAAKAAVVNFTQALAEERPDLRVNTLIPQRTSTEMRSASFPHEDPLELLQPHQVAQAAIDLLKDPQATGMSIEVRREVFEQKKKVQNLCRF